MIVTDQMIAPRSLLPAVDGLAGTSLRILEAGLVHFAADGFAATTIRDIAESASIRSASLYAHFENKEAILGALVTIGHDVHHRMLVDAVLDAGASTVDQLRALVTAHAGSHLQHPLLAKVANQEMRHLGEAARGVAESSVRQSVVLLRRILERGRETGELDVPDIDVLLSAIAAFGIAATVLATTRDEPFDPDEVAATYAALALRMAGVER